VLLRIERHAGHVGADLVKAEVASRADEYAFALSETEAPTLKAPETPKH
jgi:protease II